MFRQTKPHKKFTTHSGLEYEPVATLKNDHEVYHVVIEQGCYVCFLYTEETGFVSTHLIFPELHKVLASLPPLTQED